MAAATAARCVRGLWRNQVVSARISTRLTVQPASLFSSESGKILRASRTFREWLYINHIVVCCSKSPGYVHCKLMWLLEMI